MTQKKKRTIPPSKQMAKKLVAKRPTREGKKRGRYQIKPGKEVAGLVNLTEEEQNAKFKWDEQSSNVAVYIAAGHTASETAKVFGIGERTVYRWRAHPEFRLELIRLAHMIELSSRGERLMLANRIARQLSLKKNPTRRDLLDWLKYIQGETDGVKLDLTPLLEAAGSVASGGPKGTPEEK